MQQALLSAGLPPPGIAPGQYSGRVKSYNPKQGYGFLECPEAHARYGRDVFIHKAQMGELLGRFVGPGTRLEPTALRMRVNFSVEVNKAGMPQARDVVRIDAEAEPSPPSPVLVDGAFPSPGSSPPTSLPAPLPFAALSAPLQLPMLPLDQPEAEAWSSEDVAGKASIKGYKGRGGTIRILHEAEGQAAGVLMDDSGLAACPQPGPAGPGFGLTVAPPPHEPAGRVQNGGWQLRRPGNPRCPGVGRGGEGDPFDAQQEDCWKGMEDDLAYGMQQGGGGGYDGGTSRALPRGSKRETRGQKAKNLQQQRHQQELVPVSPSEAQPMIYSASSSQPFLQQQSAAMQPPWTLEGAVPIMTDGQLSGGQCVMYGLQGPQAMQPNSQAGGAAFAAQFQGPQQPGAPSLQYPPPYISQQFPPPPVQPPFQQDPNSPFPPQFLPYQQQQQQQFQQPFSPQQLQMLQQAYGTPQHPLVQQTPEGSRQTSPELSLSCGVTGMDQPGMASAIPDAVTPGSSSDDDDGIFRTPPTRGSMLPNGAAAAVPVHVGWQAADLDRPMGHSL